MQVMQIPNKALTHSVINVISDQEEKFYHVKYIYNITFPKENNLIMLSSYLDVNSYLFMKMPKNIKYQE